MTRLARWLVLLMVMALPAAATTTTCWDATGGTVHTGNEAGPVTRYQQSANPFIAYQGWFYPANLPLNYGIFHKTVFPNDGGVVFGFTVFAAVPTVTEPHKEICMQLSAAVPGFPPNAVSDYATGSFVNNVFSNVSIAAGHATNQTMTFNFPGVKPTWSPTGGDCSHLLCDLQPMWVGVTRIGTGDFGTFCDTVTANQAVTDGVVTSIICMTR